MTSGTPAFVAGTSSLPQKSRNRSPKSKANRHDNVLVSSSSSDKPWQLIKAGSHSPFKLSWDRVLRFYTTFGDGMLPAHNQFSQGDIVAISRNHPLAEDEGAIEGVVLERARRFIKVAVPASKSRDLGLQGRWRLDLYANQVAYERCLFALDIFSSPLVQQHGAVFHLETTEKISKSSFGWLWEGGVKFGEGASAIRGLLMKYQEDNLHLSPLQEESSSSEEEKLAVFNVSRGSEALEELKALQSPPSQISGKKLGDAKGSIRAYLQSLGEELNSSQKVAVEMAALQKVTLWQGPPGTGKTKTLTHLVAALCERRERVLACADSNVAVDNLVEGLLGQGLHVVRVGQPVKLIFHILLLATTCPTPM